MIKNQVSATILFFSITVFIFQLASCEQKKELSEEKEEHEDVELAELMFHNQRYMEKIYFAGMNKNWELAKFYHHEIEENMEKVIEGNIKEDGKDISDLVNKMLMPSLKEMKTIIESKDSVQFIKGYNLLVTTCNNCHVATDHGFVKIKTPLTPSMTNQEF